MIIVADIIRWIVLLGALTLSGSVVWRVIYSPLPHQRLITASVGVFGVVAMYTQWTRLGMTPDIRLPLTIVALGLAAHGLRRWPVQRRKDKA